MTFTVNATNAYVSVAAICLKNTVGTAIDQSNGTNSLTGVTSLQPGSVTPGSNNEVVIGMAGIGGASPSANSGYTSFASISTSSGVYDGLGAGYLVQSTAAATNPTFSWFGSSAASAVIGTFK
jgi:hypothetical protein